MARSVFLVLAALLVLPTPAVAAKHQATALRIPRKYLLVEAGQELVMSKSMTPSAAGRNTMQGLFLHGCTPACTGPTYADMHALGLYYQYASENFGNNASFLIAYLGSYYSSHAAAGRAMQAVLASLPPTVAAVRCHPSHAVTDCRDVVMAAPTGLPLSKDGVPYSFKWRLMVRDNVLFEGGYALPQSDFRSNAALADGRMHTLTRGFLSLFR
jgi:hypothetical protein